MARHRSDAERAKWVSRWRASGLSCKQFAHKHSMSSATLYRWSGQVDGASSEALPRFAEVRVVGAALGGRLEVLCSKLGYRLPDTLTVPDQIVDNRKPHYAALDAAGLAWGESRVDVSVMETLISGLLAKQLISKPSASAVPAAARDRIS